MNFLKKVIFSSTTVSETLEKLTLKWIWFDEHLWEGRPNNSGSSSGAYLNDFCKDSYKKCYDYKFLLYLLEYNWERNVLFVKRISHIHPRSSPLGDHCRKP